MAQVFDQDLRKSNGGQKRKSQLKKCFIVYELYHIMSVFTIGVPKGNDFFPKSTKDNFGFLFIIHYYNCSELLYVNR